MANSFSINSAHAAPSAGVRSKSITPLDVYSLLGLSSEHEHICPATSEAITAMTGRLVAISHTPSF